MPEKVNWPIHRILTSGIYTATSLVEIESMWTIFDVASAHQIIDLFEESRRVENEKMSRGMK